MALEQDAYLQRLDACMRVKDGRAVNAKAGLAFVSGLCNESGPFYDPACAENPHIRNALILHASRHILRAAADDQSHAARPSAQVDIRFFSGLYRESVLWPNKEAGRYPGLLRDIVETTPERDAARKQALLLMGEEAVVQANASEEVLYLRLRHSPSNHTSEAYEETAGCYQVNAAALMRFALAHVKPDSGIADRNIEDMTPSPWQEMRGMVDALCGRRAGQALNREWMIVTNDRARLGRPDADNFPRRLQLIHQAAASVALRQDGNKPDWNGVTTNTLQKGVAAYFVALMVESGMEMVEDRGLGYFEAKYALGADISEPALT